MIHGKDKAARNGQGATRTIHLPSLIVQSGAQKLFEALLYCSPHGAPSGQTSPT